MRSRRTDRTVCFYFCYDWIRTAHVEANAKAHCFPAFPFSYFYTSVSVQTPGFLFRSIEASHISVWWGGLVG